MNARAYYNEIDLYSAEWLVELMSAGLIPMGDVDRRNVEDVVPSDLSGYTQCHFFAGIGAWSFALRRAGWPDDRPCWSGSCPCQPFSAAGQGAGFADDRHLWPSWYWLIEQCHPPVVFGEQVAHKRIDPWIDLVQADMEALDYSLGAVPFPAAGVGSPQKRDRLYWVADAAGGEQQRPWQRGPGAPQEAGGRGPAGAWDQFDVLDLGDGSRRLVEPGTLPLASRSPSVVGRLRGYGNALCAEAAVAFIAAYDPSLRGTHAHEAA